MAVVVLLIGTASAEAGALPPALFSPQPLFDAAPRAARLLPPSPLWHRPISGAVPCLSAGFRRTRSDGRASAMSLRAWAAAFGALDGRSDAFQATRDFAALR